MKGNRAPSNRVVQMILLLIRNFMHLLEKGCDVLTLKINSQSEPNKVKSKGISSLYTIAVLDLNVAVMP